MQIYFVRHEKTEWNLASRFQGRHGDSPLLPESYEDIKKLGNYLKGTKFRGIYVSPLRRTFDTAQGVQQSMGISLPVHVEECLREFNLGSLEGVKFEEAGKRYPKEIDNFWNHVDLYDPSAIHGETYPEVIVRGKNSAQGMAKLYPNKNDKILAVSHGGAFCAIMGGLLGYPLSEIRKHGGLSNTSLTILGTNDGGKTFKKVVWNETDYLGRKLGATDSL